MNEANSDKGASGPIKGCIAEVIKAARAAPAIYFAPLVGAFTGVALQWKKLQPQPLAKPKLA
ncbi:hypothetical protein ACK249_005159 [Pseudomonas aeruginosa]|uniref:Uncharacterized protein n=1 Tax=Pseudomonas aeruginosa TaxID=287 RepID=A0A241XSH9_PSEAI|nr:MULTISPECIES: hypothetical protein [Pseudomonas]EIU2701996.1 hypothetical protein [Pseudomonas aeruginosa]EKF7417633.1 hypothetical protein [Pseudomonas aeruginosa]EKW9640705.1 hypothetical protein [Pseudomonas aeruginosa]EKX3430903.1 hypothetical protein [Pseudomonas aeruginosa]MBH4100068.1 hypothetical protein [Pseudomonas aeruginosa]